MLQDARTPVNKDAPIMKAQRAKILNWKASMSVSYETDSCNPGRLPVASGCKWRCGLLGPACRWSSLCPLSIAPEPFTIVAAIRSFKMAFRGKERKRARCFCGRFRQTNRRDGESRRSGDTVPHTKPEPHIRFLRSEVCP
jgi:hypothetical protein